MIIKLFQILTYRIVYIRALYIYLHCPLSYAHHMPIHRICNCSDIYVPNAWYLSTYCKQERYVTWWHDFIWPWTSQSMLLSVMDNVLHLAPNKYDVKILLYPTIYSVSDQQLLPVFSLVCCPHVGKVTILGLLAPMLMGGLGEGKWQQIWVNHSKSFVGDNPSQQNILILWWLVCDDQFLRKLNLYILLIEEILHHLVYV